MDYFVPHGHFALRKFWAIVTCLGLDVLCGAFPKIRQRRLSLKHGHAFFVILETIWIKPLEFTCMPFPKFLRLWNR